MLLNTVNISLIYDFWKLNNERNYLHDVNELSRKLNDSDTIDAQYLQHWIPNLLRLIELWEDQSLTELDELYNRLFTDKSLSDRIDAILRFLYDIQSYEMVKYFLEKNVAHYRQQKWVSSTMTGFHEACTYGFSQVCLLYIRKKSQDINATFALLYENVKTNKKEIIRNLTGLQLVCLWSKYFPKRLPSYAHTVRILLDNGARINMTSTELTTSLHWTCRAQHTTQLARDLIERGACINARDKINIEPIHYACWARNQAIVELLLAHGARLTDQDELGRTPMHFLCMPVYFEEINEEDQQQQYELMKWLLENKNITIDLTVTDNQGHTLLAYACVSKNVSLMQLLLQYRPDLLNIPTINGHTPLVIAIDECFIPAIQFLLRQPALERNVSDIAGNTAIHHACICTNIPMRLTLLRLLIDDLGGVFDLERRNEELQDPLIMCTMNQSVDLCRLLIEHNVSVTKQDVHARQCLHLACQMGNRDLVSLLLSCPGIEINAIDEKNRNCLYYAISYGDVFIVDQLLERNAEIKTRDIVGDTPLHLAVQHGKSALEMTRSLLRKQHGRDLINELAGDGLTPLLFAASCKQAAVVRLLLKYGANAKAFDDENHTALHLACKSACIESAFYLIEFGHLDVNELNCYRQTPLFYAFASNDYELVQYLISCGAQIDARDSQGYLPLHFSILSCTMENYNLNLIDLYKDEYAKLLYDQNNECEMSPLILACMEGKIDIAKHLVLKHKVNVMSTCSNGHTALHYASTTETAHCLELIEFLSEHGCALKEIDKPKGCFLFTIIQHGHRKAIMFFIDQWLKNKPDINEQHYGATLLDLLYERAQLHCNDIDTEHLSDLFEKGACFYIANLPILPCPLINDCPHFYVTLLEYNCPSIYNSSVFILYLLHSVAHWPEKTFSPKDKATHEPLTVCNYFFHIVQLTQYFYSIDRLFSIIDRRLFPQLESKQSNKETDHLRQQLDTLKSTPLKLSEVARKIIRTRVKIPSKKQFERLGLNGHLVKFLLKCTF